MGKSRIRQGNKVSWKDLFIVVCIVVATSACTPLPPLQTYPGSPKPRQEVAHIAHFGGVGVLKIDGRRTKSRWEYEVLPGDHEVVVSYYSYGYHVRTTGKNMAFSFRAEAGKAYVIWPAREGNYWHPMVECVNDHWIDLTIQAYISGDQLPARIGEPQWVPLSNVRVARGIMF